MTPAVTPRAYARAIGSQPPDPSYGLDIETDTVVDGLDPRIAAVVAVAVVGDGFEEVFEGSERGILRDVDDLLAGLAPGVIVTWNGGGFDLPFLADRAARHGVRLGLRLAADPTIPGRHDPLPGHRGAYRATWHHHRHLDGYRLFRADVGARLDLPCGLKPLARLVGLPVIEVDRARIHELSGPERRAYVASDAHLARALVARRPDAGRAVDRPPGADHPASIAS